jgi:hypothetical protein
MADEYQSTDRRPENTNPETARLLLEGILTIPVADFSAVTGGYSGTGEIEITQLNDLGNRLKGSDPQTLKVEIYHTEKLTPGGQIDDYFRPVPYVVFNNLSTGEVLKQARYEIHNVYVIADSLYASYLSMTYFQSTLPGREQSFSYKIYSTIFGFDDT